jgi:HAE1 family hydrophobic/amphiphilic exporter-1
MFSHFFIRRPIFAAVLSIVIMLLGAFALLSLPVERYPDIAPPSVQVVANYPGADAQTVADTVASPIEQEVNGVENMIYMSSICANDGSMTLTVSFATGTDPDMSQVLVQNRVNKATSQLPQEVQRLGVQVDKQMKDANLYLALISPDGRYDDIFLANYVNLYIKDELARVAGVGKVQTFGAEKFSMRLWLDPDKMTARKVTVDEVLNAVKEQNVQVAAGNIGEPPAPPGQEFQYTINVKGRLSDPEEFADIIIRTGDSGQVLRLGDVARVELGAENYKLQAQLNGKPAAAMGVYQVPGANALAVAKGVKARVEQLAQNFPEGIDMVVVYDNTRMIVASMEEVIVTLFMTLILVVLVVYVFLQSFRATLIPTLTIPVSLIGTFGAMAVLGFSINLLTLFGLILVIGIVVDDAIVVVENCTRHLEEGMSPKDAAMLTMTEVSGPVVATTLVLLAVFVPTAFMGGITGILFQQFAITISVATVFSSINALTLSPALCGVLLRKGSGRVNWFFRLFNTGMDKTTNGYHATVRAFMRKAALGVLLFVAMTVLAGWGFVRLPTGFVPQEDEGYCILSVQLPDAASLQRTAAVMDQVNAIVEDTPGVENTLTISGFSLLDGAASSNMAFSIAVFKDWSERPPDQHQSAILMSINKRLSRLMDALAFAFPTPSLPGLGLTGGFTLMLQDRGGVGLETLAQVGDEFIAAGNSQSAITGMSTTFRANVPQLFVDIDRDQVKNRGLSFTSVFDAMQTYLGSSYINDFTRYNRVFKVKAQADPQARSKVDDIGKLEVPTADGQMTPLAGIISVSEVLGPQTITRYNLYPSVKVLGNSAPGYSSGQSMAVIENMAAQSLPNSMGYEWTDLSYQQALASGGGTLLIFALAIILVYLVLAAQYESWTLPISVCLSVPTALLGAVAALMLRGYDNNLYTQIGIVLLIGLSTKSAILIVEFAKEQRDHGMSPFDAALSAARLRFRAVLMTAFSFILGVIPLLVATGAGAESRKAIGTSVFGGMLVATVVSVIVVPMLYYVIQTLAEKFGGAQPAPIPAAPTSPEPDASHEA